MHCKSLQSAEAEFLIYFTEEYFTLINIIILSLNSYECAANKENKCIFSCPLINLLFHIYCVIGLETLPAELQRNFNLMRDLDTRAQGKMTRFIRIKTVKS